MAVEKIHGGVRFSIELSERELVLIRKFDFFKEFEIEYLAVDLTMADHYEGKTRRFRLWCDVPDTAHDRFAVKCGFALGEAFNASNETGWLLMELVNRMNDGNPGYTPYEIPEDRSQGFRYQFIDPKTMKVL